MRFFSRASVVGADQTVLRFDAKRERVDGGNGHGCIMCRDFGLDLRQMREHPVPARLQFARDQPIGWIGSIVLPEGAVGGVARRFEVAAEGLARLIPPFSAAVAAAVAPGPTTASNAFSMASSTRRPLKAMQ